MANERLLTAFWGREYQVGKDSSREQPERASRGDVSSHLFVGWALAVEIWSDLAGPITKSLTWLGGLEKLHGEAIGQCRPQFAMSGTSKTREIDDGYEYNGEDFDNREEDLTIEDEGINNDGEAQAVQEVHYIVDIGLNKVQQDDGLEFTGIPKGIPSVAKYLALHFGYSNCVIVEVFAWFDDDASIQLLNLILLIMQL
ncbi:hypothetical protein F0562_013927 [Nyssa sinensis]|uniref:Uncharacterized protein n=1 Tax=Nyssa sinensis TaxID=561372 RepID=A0A5J4ZPM0_9ASTE|nr:hypothetical protein F0562_013927 [Nyssa sinensis]